MYLLSRLMLIASFCVVAMNFVIVMAILAEMSWFFPAFFGAVMVFRGLRRKPAELWAFGDARFASESEVRKAGMIGVKKGPIIGRLEPGKRGQRMKAFARLFDPRVGNEEACKRFFDGLRGKDLGPIVRLTKSIHTAVIGPTGAGKGVSFCLPFLIESQDSAIVLDYKGELASISAKHRSRLGECAVMDPYKLVTS